MIVDAMAFEPDESMSPIPTPLPLTRESNEEDDFTVEHSSSEISSKDSEEELEGDEECEGFTRQRGRVRG